MKLRPTAMFALVLAGSSAAMSCSSMGRDAARLNGRAISVERVEGLAQELAVAYQMDGDTLPSDSVRLVLNRLIMTELRADYLAASNDPVTDAEFADVEAQVGDRLKDVGIGLRSMQIRARAVDARIASTTDDPARALTVLEQFGVDPAVADAEVWVNPSFGAWDDEQNRVVGLSQMGEPVGE